MVEVHSVNICNNQYNNSGIGTSNNKNVVFKSVVMQSGRNENSRSIALKRVSIITGFVSLASMTACSVRNKSKWLKKHHKQLAILSLVCALAHVVTGIIAHKKR